MRGKKCPCRNEKPALKEKQNGKIVEGWGQSVWKVSRVSKFGQVDMGTY